MGLFTDPIETIKKTVAQIESWFATLPVWMQTLVTKLVSQEGAILSGLVEVAKNDLLAAPLTTATIVASAKDIFAKLATENISTFTLQDVFSALNAALSGSTPPQTPAA